MTHDALITKLRAAPCGSRELDAEIARALGWNQCAIGDGWINLDHCTEPLPKFSTSIDAALTLIDCKSDKITIKLYYNHAKVKIERYCFCIEYSCVETHLSAPLAICIAALQARDPE